MKWRAAAIAVVPILAACTIGALTGRASDEWTRTYQLAPGTSFEIGNTNGRVEVEGIDGSTVEVRAEKIARATTDGAAQDLLQKIKIDEKVTHDRIVVQTAKIEGLLIGAAVEVRYHVRVPRSAEVVVQTTNGPISLTGLGGRVDAITTNGAVTGDRLAGVIHARTTNGPIRVDLAQAGTERVDISTTNGAVRLAVPESTRANLVASCTNGRVDVSGLKLDIQQESRRRIEAKLNGGGMPIELHTVNGGIRVRSTGAAPSTADK